MKSGDVKLIDFGLATREQSRKLVGTLPYVCPELYGGNDATEAADVWAMGIINFEMW